MIIIMFNSIEKQIVTDENDQKSELPKLKTGFKMPVNYIKEYFQLKTLISIPHIEISSFYHKIHTIRSIFITQMESPKDFLVKQYNIKLSIGVTDKIIHSSKQIIRKVQSLNKTNFTYQQEIDNNKIRRIYFGQMSFGKKQGYGIYAEYQTNPIKQNGSHFYFYQGFFSGNYKNGLGMQWSQNRIFIGQFINNTHFSHAEAIFLYNNGDIYVGSIFNYKRNGRGVLFQSKPKNNQFYKYQTSQRYSQYETIIIGNWQDDDITRKKKFMLTTNFKQIFSMNLYDFQSNLIIKATSVYVGDVKKSPTIEQNNQDSKQFFMKDGRGFEYFSNGDVYKGQYLNYKPHGYGHYIWSNKDQFHGQFMNGQREGSGQWKGQNGQLFEGQYHKDKRNGYGIYHWPNGNVYEGQFKNDERNGIGKMTWQNGQIYMGKWKNGAQHGQGQVRAHLFSCPVKKQFLFQNGKAVKSQSTRKELNELKVSPKRKLSNKTNKQKSQQNRIRLNFSMDHMKTKKNKQILYQTKLHPSIYNAFKIPSIQSKQKQHVEQLQRIKSQQNQVHKEQPQKLRQINTKLKFTKKQKIKSTLHPRNVQQKVFGETLLKPIKWTNFHQNQEQNQT